MDEAERLDSWKQIAAYLGKSERTVRRWQETEGLPIHRHLHQQRGSVWAYRDELDEWLKRRLSPVPFVSDVRFRRRPRGAVAIVFAATTFGVGVLLFRPHRDPPPLPEPVQITAVPGKVFTPSFAPSGDRIVFHWTPHDGPVAGLFVKTIGDDNLAPLVTTQRGGDQFVYSPAWSPDGTTIAFLRRITPPSRLRVVRRDQRNVAVPDQRGRRTGAAAHPPV